VVSGQRPSFDSNFVDRCQNWEMLGADRSKHAKNIDCFVYLAQACTVQREVRVAFCCSGICRRFHHDNTANLFDKFAD